MLTTDRLLHARAVGKPIPQEALYRSLERLKHGTSRLRRLTDELLDVTRIERGRLELDPVTVDLGALARQVVEDLKFDLGAAGCPTRIEIEEGVAGVWDPSRLEQVITNLLTNALKFGQGHPIEIRVHNAGEAARLTVRDHGVGIDPGRQPFVFDRFERAVSSRELWRARPRALHRPPHHRGARRHRGCRERAQPGRHLHRHAPLGGPALLAGDLPGRAAPLRRGIPFVSHLSQAPLIYGAFDEMWTNPGLGRARLALAKEKPMARPPVASNRWSSVPFTMCAIAIAGALSACSPVGGDNTGTAGTGSPGTGGSGSGNAGTTGNGGSGSGVAGTTGTAAASAAGTGGRAGHRRIGDGHRRIGSRHRAARRRQARGTRRRARHRRSRGATAAPGSRRAGRRAAATGGGRPPPAATGTTGRAAPATAYNPNFKEFYGDDCTVADPKDMSITGLPDLFAKLDGTKMSKKSDWRCRRAELKKIVEKYIHGPKPGKPDMVTGTVSTTAINVYVTHMGKSTSFSVSVSLPTGTTGPVPIIIGMGGSSLDATIVSGEGVATGTYDHQAIASETSRSGKFTTIYGTGTGASAQVGWAWGISRVIDVLVAEKAAGRNNIIDPTGVGVTGCSRNGKAAFTVGAWDERIALGIPQESGTGGVSAFRVVNTAPKGPNGMPAQSLDSAWTEAQGWFGVAFRHLPRPRRRTRSRATRRRWSRCTRRADCSCSTTRASVSCARPASTRPAWPARRCTRRSASGRTSVTTAATRPTRTTTARSTRRRRASRSSARSGRT